MKKINSNDIINILIAKELKQFEENFKIQPIPYSQDICSLSIAWLCYYCKGIISRKNKNEIIEFIENVLNSKEYDITGWSRIPAILAASYVLTEEELFLNELVNNLDCYQSAEREFIIKCAAVICPIIPSENEYFRDALKLNLIKRHGFADTDVIIYLNSKGEYEEKIKWLKEISENINESSDILSKAISGESISNQFCKETLNEIKSYILFRFIENDIIIQEDLFDFDIESDIILASIEDRHPLIKEIIDF